MNFVRTLWEGMTCKIPANFDVTVEARERNIVARLARGNARLQFGMFTTEEDLAREKARVLQHKFTVLGSSCQKVYPL